MYSTRKKEQLIFIEAECHNRNSYFLFIFEHLDCEYFSILSLLFGEKSSSPFIPSVRKKKKKSAHSFPGHRNRLELQDRIKGIFLFFAGGWEMESRQWN